MVPRVVMPCDRGCNCPNPAISSCDIGFQASDNPASGVSEYLKQRPGTWLFAVECVQWASERIRLMGLGSPQPEPRHGLRRIIGQGLQTNIYCITIYILSRKADLLIMSQADAKPIEVPYLPCSFLMIPVESLPSITALSEGYEKLSRHISARDKADSLQK